jgi:(2R)-sulfolactate sulfo-lyase subunit alpha
MIHCLLHNANDSVAVVVTENVKAGMDLSALILEGDQVISVRSTEDIPIGHKLALKDMKPGDTVIKYGVDIGKIVAPVKQGEHVHVHNLKTKRW